MGKKKEYSNKEAITEFKSIIERLDGNEYKYINGIINIKNKKSNNIFIKPSELLWNDILENNIIEMSELSVENNDDYNIINTSKYLISEEWLEIKDIDLYSGSLHNMNINGCDIIINRSLIPIKLRKAEYNNIYYRTAKENDIIIFILMKRFILPLDGYSFDTFRLFNIL